MSIAPVDKSGIDPAHGRPDPDVARRILDALAGLRFGSLEIIVHDGHVVQIERREKVRLPQTGFQHAQTGRAAR